MRKIILLLCTAFLVLAGCGQPDSVAWTPPPPPEQVKGSLACQVKQAVTGTSLLAEWTQFNRQDLDELRRVAGITDETKRKKEALKQWRELWAVYLAWKERGSEELGSSGIRVYGPVAAGWLNEILGAMRKRESVIAGEDLTDELSVRQPRLAGGSTPHKGSRWYELAGLKNMGWWTAMGDEDAGTLFSDQEAVVSIQAVLANTTYPLNDGLFDGTEIYLFPGRMFYRDNAPLTNLPVGLAQLVGTPDYAEEINAYSPDALLWTVRIFMSWPGTALQVPHELGHAWFFRQHFNPYGIKDVHLTWANFRRPAVPAGLLECPDSTLDDDALLESGSAEMPWETKPTECLAEDFAGIFFPDILNGQTRWRHGWPNIFAMGEENTAIRERLRDLFLTNPRNFGAYHSLCLDPLPRLVGSGEAPMITGKALPGAKVKLILVGSGATNVISEMVAEPDGQFALDLDLGHLPKTVDRLLGRVLCVAMETDDLRPTWKEIQVYQAE